jgi:hypothetical protein
MFVTCKDLMSSLCTEYGSRRVGTDGSLKKL